MATPRGHFLKLGIFVITGSTLLLLATYLIGREQQVFSKTFELTTVFENVAGLQTGNNVRYSGINVGTVKDIEMENDTTIRVRMRIDEAIRPHIKTNAIAAVGSDGIVGSMLINILPAEGQGEPVRSGDELQSYSRISTHDMLTTLNVTNENAALLTADLLQVTQALRNGNGLLGQLLRDSTLADDLRESVSNLKLATARSGEAIGRVNSLLAGLRFEESTAALLLDDPEFSSQLQRVAANLDTSGQQMRILTTRLNGLVGNLETGKGSLGVLLQDSIAAAHLSNSLQHLDSGLQKFDENMEALKSSFLTRRYFRKLERQQAKQQKEK